jgi:hypothetical protein
MNDPEASPRSEGTDPLSTKLSTMISTGLCTGHPAIDDPVNAADKAPIDSCGHLTAAPYDGSPR